MNISLSDKDILNMLDRKCNLLTYTELANYNNLNDALGEYKTLVILYMTKNNYGHWCCLFLRDDNILEFFDSYGIFIDDELEFIPDNYRIVSNQSYPHLTYLIYNSQYKNVEYNQYKLQKMTPEINTCGRWVVVRIMLKRLSLDEFAQKFKNNGDEMVVQLTTK